jgi:choline transport protein
MFAWTFGTAFSSLSGANALIGIYSLYHPDYSPERWQIFIAFLGLTWIACCIVMFGQQQIARLANGFAFICVAIWFVSLMVCATMPATTTQGYATHESIWQQWSNGAGYSSNGFVFCLGMLNGAYAIGTPDGCSHRALLGSLKYRSC